MSGEASRVLSDDDVLAIAEAMTVQLKKEKSDFYISDERHYEHHQAWSKFDDEKIRTMHDLINAYRNARSLFWRGFLGLVIIGSLAAAAVGLGFKG